MCSFFFCKYLLKLQIYEKRKWEFWCMEIMKIGKIKMEDSINIKGKSGKVKL